MHGACYIETKYEPPRAKLWNKLGLKRKVQKLQCIFTSPPTTHSHTQTPDHLHSIQEDFGTCLTLLSHPTFFIQNHRDVDLGGIAIMGVARPSFHSMVEAPSGSGNYPQFPLIFLFYPTSLETRHTCRFCIGIRLS